MDIYPYKEELANALTHGVGSVMLLVLCPLLISFAVQTKNTGKIVGVCLFSFGLLAVYFSSTIFHSIPYKFTKAVMAYFDLIAIYFLIAGTYTAFILVYFKSKKGYSLLVTIWTISALGTYLVVFLPGISIIYSLIIYLILGWVGIVLIKPSLRKVSAKILSLIVLGGLSYTIGTYFFYYDNEVKYYHAIWHLFTLAGSLFHWVAIFFAVREDNQGATIISPH